MNANEPQPLPTTPPQVLSMTDEEGDIAQFQAYLVSLPPEALWDVLAHIDVELYPRRYETVEREITRRGLFFVTPYTASELRLRAVVCACSGFSALALALRMIGSMVIQIEPWEHLSWFFDLAVGGPKAARMVLPLARLLAVGGVLVAFAGVMTALERFLRRRLRADLLATVAAAALVSLLLTWLACRA